MGEKLKEYKIFIEGEEFKDVKELKIIKKRRIKSMNINGKGLKIKIKEIFCRHKNTQSMVKKEKFHALCGTTVYEVCQDCGKILDSYLDPTL